jgi:two-component system, NarL family, response regulator NreC
MPISILLADDHAILRQGLKRILASHEEFVVVAEASTGLEAVRMAEEFKPGVAVVDIAMKDMNGIEATSQIIRVSHQTVVLILSMYCDEAYVIRAIRAGAAGYLLKDSVEDDLVRAILEVSKNGHYFSPGIAEVVPKGYRRLQTSGQSPDRFEWLTRMERVVYQMIAEGNSNKEIGVKLDISTHTVETHRARIMDKLAVHNVAELVLSAVRRGLVH